MTVFPPGQQANIRRSVEEIDNKYSAFKFSYPIVGLNAKGTTQTVNMAGNHIFVARLDSYVACYVKLDSDRNPWIRILPGDVITRDFKKFYFRVADDISVPITVSGRRHSGLLYISNGPLITRRFKKSGVYPFAFAKGQIPITTTPTSIALLMALSTPNQSRPLTTGAYGGTLIITNTGSVTVWLSFSGNNVVAPAPGSMISWFPILPGSTFTMELGTVLNANKDDDIPQIVVQAGTGEIAAIIDPECDFDYRPNSVASNQSDTFSLTDT